MPFSVLVNGNSRAPAGHPPRYHREISPDLTRLAAKATIWTSLSGQAHGCSHTLPCHFLKESRHVCKRQAGKVCLPAAGRGHQLNRLTGGARPSGSKPAACIELHYEA